MIFKKTFANWFLFLIYPYVWTSSGVCDSTLGSRCLGRLVLMSIFCLTVVLGQRKALILTLGGRVVAPKGI